MKMIQSQHFSRYKSVCFFSRPSRAANSAALNNSPIWPNFELVQDFMVVLVTCKKEEDLIENEDARVFTTLYINFSDAQGQITLESVVVSGQNFKLIQAFMHVLITCKIEDDSIKNEGARVVKTFEVYGDFSRCSRAASSAVLSLNWPNFEVVPDVMDVVITCKNEEDPIKNEGTRVVTRFSPL